jgi:uncharacterized protein (DUF433 family)
MSAVAQRLGQGRISFELSNDSTLVVHLLGPWHLQRDLPPISLLLAELGSGPGIKRLSYETAQLTHWDSGLISFLTNRNYEWIVRDPDLLGGKLAVRRTRLSVSFVLACLAEGMSAEEITDTYGAFPKEAIPEIMRV